MLTKPRAEAIRRLLEALLDSSEADLLTVTNDAVVAVAHAWFVRAVQTVRATLLLHDSGLDEVTSPLLRSAMEHAVGVAWIHQAGTDGLHSLGWEKQAWAEKVQRAVAVSNERETGSERRDWSPEMQAALADVIALDIPANKLNVQLKHLYRFQAVKAYDLFVGWLSETSYSHATDASAQPYVVMQADRFLLLADSRRPAETLLLRCVAVAVMACRSMGSVLGSDVWAAKVGALDHEMGLILQQARADGWVSSTETAEWRARFDR